VQALPFSPRTHRGVTLPEVLVVFAIASVAALVSIPTLAEVAAQSTLRSASSDVAVLLSRARNRAAMERRDVGVRWIATPDDLVATTYEDGNENGILSEDIAHGVDRAVEGPVSMRGRWHGVTFSILPTEFLLDPDGGPVGNVNDPLRFGRSNICTFGPTGHASPGSLWISNGKNRQAIVRVSPASGRIQVLEWSTVTGKWVRRS